MALSNELLQISTLKIQLAGEKDKNNHLKMAEYDFKNVYLELVNCFFDLWKKTHDCYVDDFIDSLPEAKYKYCIRFNISTSNYIIL